MMKTPKHRHRAGSKLWNTNVLNRSLSMKPAKNALSISRQILQSSVVHGQAGDGLFENNVQLAKRVSELQSELTAQVESTRLARLELFQLRLKYNRLKENSQTIGAVMEWTDCSIEFATKAKEALSKILFQTRVSIDSPQLGTELSMETSNVIVENNSILSPPKVSPTPASPKSQVAESSLNVSDMDCSNVEWAEKDNQPEASAQHAFGIEHLPHEVDNFCVSSLDSVVPPTSALSPHLPSSPLVLTSRKAVTFQLPGETEDPVVVTKRRKRVRVIPDDSVFLPVQEPQPALDAERQLPAKGSVIENNYSPFSDITNSPKRPRRHIAGTINYLEPAINLKVRRGDVNWCRK